LNETELVFQHGGEVPDLEKGPDLTEFDIESTLEAGEIGAWEWDLAGGQMRWSEQMFRNIGVEPAESVNLYMALLAAIHTGDRQDVAAAFANFRTRPGPLRIEARLASPANDPRWIVFLGRTVVGPHGAPAYMRGITIDSTQRRKNEEASAAALLASQRQLRELNDKLRAG
jgi:PAS domain-containing protein